MMRSTMGACTIRCQCMYAQTHRRRRERDCDCRSIGVSYARTGYHRKLVCSVVWSICWAVFSKWKLLKQTKNQPINNLRIQCVYINKSFVFRCKLFISFCALRSLWFFLVVCLVLCCDFLYANQHKNYIGFDLLYLISDVCVCACFFVIIRHTGSRSLNK